MNPLLEALLQRMMTPKSTTLPRMRAPGQEPAFSAADPDTAFPVGTRDTMKDVGMVAGPGGLLGKLGGAALGGAAGAMGGAAKAVPGAAGGAGGQLLGQTAAEFAPVGGEAAYNAGRSAAKSQGLTESLYKRMMSSGRGNIGSETGEIHPGAAVGIGAALGGGGYAAKKLYDLLQKIKDPATGIQSNPSAAPDILDTAAGRRGKY